MTEQRLWMLVAQIYAHLLTAQQMFGDRDTLYSDEREHVREHLNAAIAVAQKLFSTEADGLRESASDADVAYRQLSLLLRRPAGGLRESASDADSQSEHRIPQ